jgi:hypothetical protein
MHDPHKLNVKIILTTDNISEDMLPLLALLNLFRSISTLSTPFAVLLASIVAMASGILLARN